MTKIEAETILDECECEDYAFEIRMKSGLMFLVATYQEPDTYSEKLENQTTRKWYISQHATKSEVVQTALKCVLTSREHRVREAFTYRDKRIFGPHFDVDRLVELGKRDDILDTREDRA